MTATPRDRLFRLLRLLELLRSGRMNAVSLAVELETTERTVRRDVALLREAGIPIVFDREKQAFGVEGNYLLPPANFKAEEALALLVLCLDVGEAPQIPFFDSARNAAMKLAAMLPQGLGDRVRATNSALSIRLPQTNRLEDHRSVFDDLIDAYHDRRAVRIVYKSPVESGEFETLLQPYKLMFSVRSWYVIGRSSLHKQVRTFHVGRIRQVERTDRRFTIPGNFSLKRYLGNAWRMIPEGGRDHRVHVRFSPFVAENVAEVCWHDTQQVTRRDDGSLDFEVTVSGLNEISWWILGYGHHAHVLKPKALRKIVASHIGRLCEEYADELSDLSQADAPE